MAIVSALLLGLGMFSDVGLTSNVIHNPKGDDPDFLNTAWTLQVLRGFALFVLAVCLAWPVSEMYKDNDPLAGELLYLIPATALSTLISGFHSAKLMVAARQLQIKETIKIEFVVTPFNLVATFLLAWSLRSVYALPIASILSNLLYVALSFWMLEGPKSKFRWDSNSIRAIVSYGKWIFLSTLITFLAMQMDRLALAGMYSFVEVGVYSIAASLAVLAPSIAGGLQGSVLFPWYTRMLEQGMPIHVAFARTRMAMMSFSSFLCTLLFAGAGSFFELAYDSRYAMAGVLLPILVVGAWFSCLETMYGATFLASGRPKWVALTSLSKVVTFGFSLIVLSIFKLDIVVASLCVSASEMFRWLVCYLFGRQLGLKNSLTDLSMFVFFISVALAGWWLVEEAPLISSLSPFLRLAFLGVSAGLVFTPLFFRFCYPLMKKN